MSSRCRLVGSKARRLGRVPRGGGWRCAAFCLTCVLLAHADAQPDIPIVAVAIKCLKSWSEIR
eukprot:2256167-Prymnesium_polylepis.3